MCSVLLKGPDTLIATPGEPLLVVETSQFDLSWGDEALDDLLKQLRGMGKGTRYYVPRTK